MLYDNATILTMNARREILQHGAVVVRGNRFEAVGPRRELCERYPEEAVMDLKGNILLPGLIDTHVHMAQCMLRGVSEGRKFQDLSNWLIERIFPLQGSYSEADGLASASLCVLEMLKSGTTGFVECLLAEKYGFDAIAEMCVRSGIRAALGKVVMAVSPEWRDRLRWHPGMWQSRESSIENTLRAFERWNGAGDGRIQVWFGCRSFEPANDPSLFDEVSALAKERNMGITIHLLERPVDTEYARAHGYRTLGEFAAAKGLLGPRTVLAHCVIADDGDRRLIADTGSSVAHCPANNATAGWGPAPVLEMLEVGVNVSLGCDGAPSNANMDLLRDLRVAAHAQRTRKQTRMVLSAETILEMATLNGAKALGISDQVGSIEPGKRADFIVINTDAPHLTPVWNPVASVVFAAQGSDVDTVVIDGQLIMRGRKILTLDEEAILEDVRQRFHEVAKRAGIHDIAPLWPIV